MADEKEAETEDNKAEEKPKGSKKLLIIGLLLGLLVGGGGGAGAFFMLGGNHEVAEEPPEDTHEEAAPEEETHFSYVKIERLTVPLIDGKRMLGNVVLDLSLEVDGDENKIKIVRYLPEIRDALLRHYSENPVGKRDYPRSIDYVRLKKTTRDICNKILHEDVVSRVMVVQVQQF